MKLPQVLSDRYKLKDTEALVRAAMAQAWVVYHLAGALAQKKSERGHKVYAASILTRVAMDIHHFILRSCPSCFEHHTDFLKKNPINGHIQDFEAYVFGLHNAVNERAGRELCTDLDSVRAHYRKQLARLEEAGSVTVGALADALPTTNGRYCYTC